MTSSSSALQNGAILNKRYIIEKQLGAGGFGITYQGFDPNLKVRVAIKEFFPRHIAERQSDGKTISPFGSESLQEYRKGITSFLDEARIVAQFDHPNIVSVKDYFEENSTAYMVMGYVEGIPLNKMVEERGGRLDFETAFNIVLPVFDALQKIHSAALIHRDVSPDNIYFTKEGSVKLLDFGAARFVVGGDQNMTLMLKEGYAPLEQYSRSGNQGVWTDIYAFASTIYRLITGIVPPPALDRMHGVALLPPSKFCKIPPDSEKALIKAMSLKIEDRFRTISEFRAAFSSGTTITFREENGAKPLSKKKVGMAAIFAAIFVLSLIGFMFLSKKGETQPDNSREQMPVAVKTQKETLPVTIKTENKLPAKLIEKPETEKKDKKESDVQPVPAFAESSKKEVPVTGYSKAEMAKLFKKALQLAKSGKVTEAESIFTETCGSDYAAACYQLGVLQKSIIYFEKAKSLYQKECSSGNAESCLNLGSMLGRGEGSEKSEAKGLEFIQKSCELNLSYGCFALGQIWENGMGVSPDKNKAAEYYKKACSLGLKESCSTF